MKLHEIATALDCAVAGDPNTEITGVATIETAPPGSITFFNNRKYRKYLASTAAAAVIVENAQDIPSNLAGLVSPHPYLTFARALSLFLADVSHQPEIHLTAQVSPTAVLGRGVSIGAFSIVDAGVKLEDGVTILNHCHIYHDVTIGKASFIHSHAVIREGCVLGERVILQNGAIVGSDGFGYARRPDKSWHKIPQTGKVIIEDDVEIGAGATIDRATLGATTVRRGTKIDNLVQIGHGSTVGEDTLLCAQVGLAGSSEIGDRVILSGQVGVAGHLKIGDGVIATAQSGIPNSVPEGRLISGYPAIDNRNWLKSSAVFAALPDVLREVRRLTDRVRMLEEKLGEPTEK